MQGKGIEDIILEVNREIKGTKTEADAYTRAVFRVLQRMILEHGTVRTPLGTFRVKEWKERLIRNKITGEKPVYVPRRKVLTFSPSERIKKLLRGEKNET